jgi:hypothetical protein
MADEPATRRDTAIDFGRLQRIELVQLAAAIVFGASLFLEWYVPDSANPNSNVEGHHDAVSAWTAHPVLRWFFLAALVAALWSVWQTITAQQPTQGFRRGETSVVVASIVLVLVLFQGVIDRPGAPSGTIDLGVGWFVALAAAIAAVGAAVARLPAQRKPPGV